jgi:DNA repair protein RadC
MSSHKKLRTEGDWQHPGGKLLIAGPESLSDIELLAIIVSSGSRKKPAVQIAKELIERFGSFRGMSSQDLNEMLKIKGLGQVKLCRIAAAFEIARRIVSDVLSER